MSRRVRSHTALAVLLATTLAGCSRIYVDWDRLTIQRTPYEAPKPVLPATVAPRTDNVTSQPQSASLPKRKRRHPTSPADTKERSIEPDTSQSSLPPPSTISMTTPGSSDTAEKEIEATSQRLARFDRNRLSGPTLATYDQANGFLNQGKQALAEKDYVAASGFAQKASVLADRLQATVTAQ